MFTSYRVAFVLLLFQGTSVLAQEITVQFRPEKEEYQVGEPVFLVLDLVNAGSQTIRVSDGVCWTSAQFDIPDAPARRGVSPDYLRAQAERAYRRAAKSGLKGSRSRF